MTSASFGRRGLLLGVAARLVTSGLILCARSAFAGRGEPDAAGPFRAPLARFTTSYEIEGEHKSRAFNVAIAAEAIDGRVIAPGGVFSFNDVVGERTRAQGYERSIVLRDGLLAEGTGGGACQVASTLHAAALLAGLDVVDRTAHSRPSAYIRMGLDATVVFPKTDLRLGNPTKREVVIRARTHRGALSVAFESAREGRPHVVLRSEILERVPYERTLVRDARVPEGEVHRRAYGIPGYRVGRTREVTAEGETRTDRRTNVYAPVPEILVLHPSFDLQRLELTHPEETPLGWTTPPKMLDEPGVRPPAPLQLRPTTRVVMDNERDVTD